MIIVYKIYENWRVRRRFRSGDNASLLGSTHSKLTLQESLGYIDAQFNDYLAYSGLAEANLRGKRILEIGFGDNVGVALKFLAAGAAQVVCLDKFYARRNAQQQSEIYKNLRATLTDPQRDRFDQAIDLSDGIRCNPERLRCIYGADADELEDLFSRESFDLIISRAVMQDILEPEGAFEAMDAVLAPGGFMLHKIDLSDQGMFRDNGMHPLTFLTIPDSIYRLMASHSGLSNRKLSGYYRGELARLGYEATCFPTSLIGHPGSGDQFYLCESVDLETRSAQVALAQISAIRPRLAPEFSELSDEELMIDGIFIAARKPSGSGRSNLQWREKAKASSEVVEPGAIGLRHVGETRRGRGGAADESCQKDQHVCVFNEA